MLKAKKKASKETFFIHFNRVNIHPHSTDNLPL